MSTQSLTLIATVFQLLKKKEQNSVREADINLNIN